MPQVVAAVVTDIWREKLARIYAGDTSLGGFSVPATFKIGEGGWEDILSVRQPKVPDPTLTDIEADGVTQYFFSKALTAPNLTFTSPTRLQISCIVATSEANVNLGGDPPEFYELGVFDAAGNLLVYSTFPVEIKTLSKTLQHLIYVDF